MTRRTRRCLVAVLLAIGALALAGCTSSSGGGSPSSAKASELNPNVGSGKFLGAQVDPARPRPQFTLTTAAGQSFAFGRETAKHPTLLYFGYTQCPDVCPESMADVANALKQVPAAVAKSTYVVFVTTDIKHDTGPVITKWLSTFQGLAKQVGHWVGLRGTQDEIDAAQAAAHITLASDGGQTHSAQILLYGPDDFAHVTFLQSDQEQQQIAHDLPLVATGEK